MGEYRLSYEPDSGILHCSAAGELAGDEGRAFINAMHAAIVDARHRNPVLRLLLDNRGSVVFPGSTRDALTGELRPLLQPGDRTAILVLDSLAKARVRERSGRHEAFISESAARTWLGA